MNLLLNYFIYICTIYCCWIQSTLYVCGRVSRLGPQLTGIVHFGSCLTNLFNPISGRDASHMCLQSHIEERRLPHVPYKLEPKTHGSQNGQYLLIGGRDEKPSHMFHYIKFIKKKIILYFSTHCMSLLLMFINYKR